MSRIFDGGSIEFNSSYKEAVSSAIHGNANDILKTLNSSGTGSLTIDFGDKSFPITSISIAIGNMIIGYAMTADNISSSDINIDKKVAIIYYIESGSTTKIPIITIGYVDTTTDGSISFQITVTY